MSYYYRSENQRSAPYSNYIVAQDMSCAVSWTPDSSTKGCPGTVMDFNRNVSNPVPSSAVMMPIPSNSNGYYYLGSAYPVITTAPWRLYDTTNY